MTVSPNAYTEAKDSRQACLALQFGRVGTRAHYLGPGASQARVFSLPLSLYPESCAADGKETCARFGPDAELLLSRSFWSRLLALCALPEAGRILAAAREDAFAPLLEQGPLRAAWLRSLFSSAAKEASADKSRTGPEALADARLQPAPADCGIPLRMLAPGPVSASLLRLCE
ncbi:hypothetical protein LJC59_08825, partial [Desulfovibrio sp. OttesenSCG-928-A18]|nr:hypothetical protein [Desulfovibrio sp. OttesenSCG-928-A18]